ncbi:glycerol-3-phosphate 1-O-acyltransferase PlsY [Clostridium polynesiense]|uniref:glycerol-3-phosphate 1-O-acyltransferase PlsY n=1 Tax=Clostridium polynesiense TaxID=1325933 RepID=UPI00058D4B1F|nr:glycerol-3-phosphate 1-O-acyltransferase PlsY [Clostridium polynesiense]
MGLLYITILSSFLIGSFPTGYILVKKYCGIDIRTKGSGNIGSTNVKRVAGAKIAYITQAVDILKGVIPMLAAMYIANNFNLPVDRNVFLSLTAAAAVLGHNYTPFLMFHGGKGVNTTLGSFIFIAPIPVIVGILLHILLKRVFPIVAVRSIILGVSIAVTAMIMKLPQPVINACIFAAVVMILRHRKNIQELLSKNNK